MTLESATGATTFEVVVVDDEETMLLFARRALERAGHRVRGFRDPREALPEILSRPPDVLVTDLRMPGISGHELLAEVRKAVPEVRILLVTGFGTVKDAVLAVQAGAEAFLEKPYSADELQLAVLRAGEKSLLARDNRVLREIVDRGAIFGGLIGRSKSLRKMAVTLSRVAALAGPVLIEGESGSGKELVARALHAQSPRATEPFLAVHCGALPKELLEAELFGVEAGAFTGAERARAGYVERAQGGTLFLDEIAEVPVESQSSLLRLVEGQELVRVGGQVPYRARCRVVAATHRDLRDRMESGQFKAELYFRLRVLPIQVPPLRERTDDIPLLFRAFLDRAGRTDLEVAADAQLILCAWPWPGNVRELANLAERLAATHSGGRLEVEDLPAELRGEVAVGPGVVPFRQAVLGFERHYFEDLLQRAQGNISEVARLSGLPRPTVHARLAALDLDAGGYRHRKP